MKNLVRLLGLFFILALVSLAAPKIHKLTGRVGDSKCGAMNTSKKCVTGCLHKGEQAVLVAGKHVYKFANASELNQYAGERVTVTYTFSHGKRTIASVKAS